MYSSSSSSSQHSAPATNNLTRYGSAPSSFLSNVAESVSGLGLNLNQHQHQHHHQNPNPNQNQQYFPGMRDSLAMNATESTHPGSESRNTLTLLHDSYGRNNNSPVKGTATTTTTTTTGSNLIRHSSSPAGFFNHLTSEMGYCNSKGIDSYNNQGGSISGHNLSRLGSQLSFTKQDHHVLSQISEAHEGDLLDGVTSNDTNHSLKGASSSQPRSSAGFSLSAWDENNDGFTFSGPSNKRSKNINDDILNGFVSMESQEIAFDMTSMDRLMQIPPDSVPCKIRAKRGFATHPRSIAERERRTRISGKLKKLQDLVPNMDKQTSYADMLDLAVQHIKGLQNEIQKLNSEVERCTCGCKQN